MERLSLHGKSSGESFQQSAEDDLIISNALDTDDGDSCVHEEDHGEEHWQDVDDGETSGSHAIAPLGMMGRTRNGFAKNKMPMRVEKVFSILDCDEETGFRRRARSLTGPSPVYNFGPKARTMKNSAGLMSIQDPASLRLTWYKTPFSVLVIKKIYDEDIIRPFVEIISHLVKERRMMVYVEEAILKDVKLNSNEDFDRLKDKLYTVSEGQDDLTDKIDFILCLGGDGTLLHASSLFQTSVPPVLAFHLGSLGFLTIFEYAENFKSVLTSVLEGNAKLSLRSRLKCAITKVDSDLSRIPVKNLQASHQKSMMVLNEVVIDRGPSPYLTNLDLYVEGRYVTSVQGDGLIISTPTGSTAYAVSAGASLVHPSVPAIMITPICPHSLSFRPIVLPAGVEIKVMVSPEARSTAWVSYDGRNRHELAHGELLRVATAIYPVPCICRDDQIMDWFDCLGTCMHWNVRHRQKPFIGIGNGMTPSSSSNSLCSRNSGSDTNCDNSY